MTNYKVGDRGVTRDGREADCYLIDRTNDLLRWKCGTHRWWTTRYGRYCEETIDRCDIVRRLDDAKAEPEHDADEAANDDVMSEILGGFDDPGSFITTVENHELAKDIVSKGIIGNCEAANATSHGPQRGPADLSRIRAQVAQTRRDLADAIDSLRANLRVLDGVDAELNAEQA